MNSTERAAWFTAYVSFGGTVLAAVSAGGVIWAAFIARSAARTWRRVHEHAKADECVAAAYHCYHSASKVADLHKRRLNVFEGPYQELWNSWRKMKLSYIVGRRYYTALPIEIPEEILNIINILEQQIIASQNVKQHDITDPLIIEIEARGLEVEALLWYAQKIENMLKPEPVVKAKSFRVWLGEWLLGNESLRR